MKKINIGAVSIHDFDRSCGKMFSWSFYYDKKDVFYDESYDKDVKECDPKKIVLPPEQEYTLVIDYPTSIPYKSKLKTGKKGMTRIQFADKVCKHYRKMYDEEVATPGGKYGIYGHGICDLVLCNATVKNNREIHLGVDS